MGPRSPLIKSQQRAGGTPPPQPLTSLRKRRPAQLTGSPQASCPLSRAKLLPPVQAAPPHQDRERDRWVSTNKRIGRRGPAAARGTGYPPGGAPVFMDESARPSFRIHQGPPWIGGHLRGSRGLAPEDYHRGRQPRLSTKVITQGDSHGRQSRLSHRETVIGQAYRRPIGPKPLLLGELCRGRAERVCAARVRARA